MNRTILLLFVTACFVRAEVRTMTLRETVALALQQNPDLVIARYDAAKAKYAIQIARDPFVPKLFGGSGAAWTTGYPASINGQPPSIFEAQTQMAIFNRQQSYRVAEARESARGADIDTSRQQDEVAFRAASLWLDAQQSAEAAEIARRQLDSLRRVRNGVQARMQEGQAIPLDAKKAALDLARAEQRAESLGSDQDTAEASLAVVLGFTADDRVRAAREDRVTAEPPASEQTSIEDAIANSKDLKLLESRIQSKNLELRGYKSARYPTVDLVAQYNLLARYNFQDFFPQFQRNNGQLGVSITIPLLVGSAPRGSQLQAEADFAKLQAQVNQTRGQIALNTRKDYQQVRKAESARNVARLDLDYTREQLSVLLARHDEGRATLDEVEQARIQENEKWIAYYEAQHNLERIKLNLLRQTGTLVAALQ
jgi:outer membrane protein